MARSRRSNNSKNGTTLGFEDTLWAATDKLSNNMNAARIQPRCYWPHLSKIHLLRLRRETRRETNSTSKGLLWIFSVSSLGNANIDWALRGKNFMG